MAEHPDLPKKPSVAVVWLSALVTGLAVITAVSGLFWRGGNGPFISITSRGQIVELYGQGLYRHDTIFVGAMNKGTDAVTLFVGVPVLVFITLAYRRGSLQGGLLLLGTLTYFLYVGASYSLGAVAYNDLFLVYSGLFSASLFGLMHVYASFDLCMLSQRFSSSIPRRGPALFLISSGLLTLAVWLISPISALIRGEPPERLDVYTTLFTNTLDMAVIAPVSVLAGTLILRRQPLGYLLAIPLLCLEATLALLIPAGTISQLLAGVTFAPGEIVGPIAGFVTLGLLAVWTLVAILRNVQTAEPLSDTPARDGAIKSASTGQSGVGQ